MGDISNNMDKNKFITRHQTEYFDIQNKGLEQRLDTIKISDEEKDMIIGNQTKKVIIDKTLGLFKVGEVIQTIFNWNDEIDKEIKEAKKSLLIEQYFNKVDHVEHALNRLRNLIVNPQGNVIFNKILRILDDYPPDEELIEHLSTALKFIIDNEEFEELFGQHKFALSQIERLTPQALTVLSDYSNYPIFNLPASISIGPKVSSEWQLNFVNAYCKNKRITDDSTINRVSHSITELHSSGFIEAYKIQEGKVVCEVTGIGRDILPYLT